MATKRKIKCRSCTNTIIGEESFDELAINMGWKKDGQFYDCPACQKKELEKHELRLVRPSVKKQIIAEEEK